MTAKKKLLPSREGLGQLPMHRVCAFSTACLNQYMSDCAWNTIIPCFKKNKTKYTKKKIKDEPSVPGETSCIGLFIYIWQLVMCRSSQRRQQKGFTNTVLMCQPSLSLCTAFVPGDIKVYPRCWAQLTAVTCLNCFPVQIFKWSSERREWVVLRADGI